MGDIHASELEEGSVGLLSTQENLVDNDNYVYCNERYCKIGKSDSFN